MLDLAKHQFSKDQHDQFNISLTPQSNNQINLSFLRINTIGVYFLKIRIARQEFVEKVIIIE